MSFIDKARVRDEHLIESTLADETMTIDERSRALEKIEKNRKNRKRSSIVTIFNIANTMMGSALLVMPVNFYKAGIITSIICALFMMVISYYTCNLLVIHSRNSEIDYPLALRRLLGKKWEFLFNVISFLLLILVAVIHFILMANVMYSILKSLVSSSDNWPGFDAISFKTFSMQYVGLILFVLCAVLYSYRKITTILWINDKGIYMILFFTLFIIYLGIYSLYEVDINFVSDGTPGQNQGLDLLLFHTDLSELIGIFALAYMIHNAVCGMIKSNQKQENNSRDLFIAYLIVFLYYVFLGLFGSFAVTAMFNSEYVQRGGKIPGTIMDLFTSQGKFLSKTQQAFSIISLVLIFIQLTTVLPILNFFCRRQFFSLFFGTGKKITNKQFHLFNVAFNVICLLFEIFVFPPSKVIGFTGALGGFLLIYIIPVYAHLKCLYISKDSTGNRINSDSNLEPSEENLVTDAAKRCRNHDNVKLYSKYIVYPFYILLVSFGLAILVFQLYTEISGMIK